MTQCVVAIDAGTTGIRVQAFDPEGNVLATRYREIRQIYPRPGWVEHDPTEIRQTTLSLLKQALRDVGSDAVAGIGITNQRETAILWDRTSGRPAHNAIVWQCRRTKDICDRLKAEGLDEPVRRKTGLVIDAYFSGPKVMWLLENVPKLREKACRGDIAFGTVDTWLLWNLTGGAVHATDYTNASRTMLLNIADRAWDRELLDAMSIPAEILPALRSSSGRFGSTSADIVGAEIPIAGIAGDQQAALFGQNATRPGTGKNTYGTGCFMLVPTGDTRVQSAAGLITTIACGPGGEPCFALEGSVFVAGAVIQWLRDELGVITSAGETEQICAHVHDAGGVYFVPAFAGLGAPYWDMDARGLITGMTRGTTRAHIIRSAVESIAYQSHDLLRAMVSDTGAELSELRVDGGACVNDFLMQFQADISGIRLNRPVNIESTALGAAFLAGLAVGVWGDSSELERCRKVDRIFEPRMDEATRDRLYSGWLAAVRKARA